MVSTENLVKIAQSADSALLDAIRDAYTEIGKNHLERSLLLLLPPNEQDLPGGSDVVSNFFTVFG